MDSIPGLDQWVMDPALLWLWCRPAAAAVILPLAWEPPCATGVPLKRPKTKTKKKKKKNLLCIKINLLEIKGTTVLEPFKVAESEYYRVF